MGRTGEGLAAVSRGALLHFGRGIKSGSAILVLTAGSHCIREREALCAFAVVRTGVTACVTGRSRGRVERDQISERISSFVKSPGTNYRTLQDALNYG